MSVYPAIIKDGVVVIDTDDVWIHLDYIEELSTRLAFPVTGRIVETGSDGEPLLKGVKPLPYALAVDTLRLISD